MKNISIEDKYAGGENRFRAGSENNSVIVFYHLT